MTNRYSIDPENFGQMVNDEFVDFRDRLIDELGEDAGRR